MIFDFYVYVSIFAFAIIYASAQLLPILIGQDVYQPGLATCVQEDIRTNTSYYTQCDYFRSDGCNITNFRCTLSSTISNPNGSAELITFTVTPYAAAWPGINDGKLLINLRYTDNRPFELLGVLQLWKLAPNHGNAYNYTGRVNEVVYAASVSAQTYWFHGLTSGQYVAVYWDNGGTRQGKGNPEFSQVINLKSVFNQRVDLRLRAMPIDTYNTNYQRANRNFISYQLIGPLSMRTILDAACVDPTMNRCIFWEYRTDMGNLINAKTELETVPSGPASDGFVDSMYKFKIFPLMCCSRRTRIAVRLIYNGAHPLFPTQYSDYWDQRQNYGYGTDIAYRVIQHARVYLDETLFPCTNSFPCRPQLTYQIAVNHQSFTSNPNLYPVCVSKSALNNTLTSVTPNLDVYTVNTLRRNYCQCFFTNTQCNDPDVGMIYTTQAWRAGLTQDTNNFDKYEDWTTLYDVIIGQSISTQLYGYISGRMYGLNYDFGTHINANNVFRNFAYDYSCFPFKTYYITQCVSNFPNIYSITSNCANNIAQNGLGVFADLMLDIPVGKSELQLFYNVDPENAGINSCDQLSGPSVNICGLSATSICVFDGASFQFTDYKYSINAVCAGDTALPYSFTDNSCNCLSTAGHYLWPYYAHVGTGRAMGWAWDGHVSYLFINGVGGPVVFDNGNGFINNYAKLSVELCCSDATLTYQNSLKISSAVFPPTTSQSSMVAFANNVWQGNILAVQYQFNNNDLAGTDPQIIYQYIPSPDYDGTMYPKAYSSIFPYINWSNPNICYSLYSYLLQPTNPCINFIQTSSTKATVTFSESGNNGQVSFLNTNNYGMSPFNNGALAGSVGAVFDYQLPAQPDVFGVYGLDTFPVVIDNALDDLADSQRFFQSRSIFPTYARFQMVPTVEFYGFSELTWGPSNTYTIDVSFKVLCPSINMDLTDDNVVGYVGQCAPFFTILNQNQVPMVISQVSGPSLLEPAPSSHLPFAIIPNQILGGVIQSAEFTVTILYDPPNNGDTLYWYFFPKTEPEKPAGDAFCGSTSFSSYSGYMIANETVALPDQSTRILAMICSLRSVPPACEYNQPQMLAACFRGDPFDYAVCPMQDLPSYETTGNPLDYGRCTNYWFDWVINGTKVYGMATYAQTYNSETTLTIYDQQSVIPNLVPPLPITIAVYPNPLVRDTQCTNKNATCFTPNSNTNKTGFTVVDQIHYCAIDGVTNMIILQPNLVFAYPFNFQDQVGAMYCNKTTEFIDVFVQELQTKALFGIQLQCNVSSTGYYTYTIRYGKSISAIASGTDFPCYERLISYAIILTSFQAEPGVLFRVPNCTRPDNCCYQMPINVFGNTGNSDNIVNLNTCNSGPNALPECMYEIVTSPMTPAFPNLCLGSTYTFTVRSPAALVQNREQPSTGNFFQYPWRCQSTFEITLPTLGFSPIGALVTNGDCRYEGSFLELSYTYTNPVCTNGITVNNTNPECQYSLWFAIEPTQVPCNCYAESFARLAHPLLLNGPNTANYNLESIINFPQILPAGHVTSIPDGIYTVYFWISQSATSPYYPYSSFASLVNAQPRNGIQSQVTVQFDNANGLKIIMQYTTYPQCPAKYGDNITTSSIAIGINLRDNNYNGPYNLTFLTPTNQLVSNYIIGTSEACCSTCGSIANQNIYCNISCAACDIYVRDQGLNHIFYVGTGVYTPGEQGLYYISANAAVTHCTASYFPYIVPLNTFKTNITCVSPSCFGVKNGAVYSTTQGGTQIPITQAELIQNSDLTVATARYYYVWSGNFGANTNLSLVYRNQTYLPFVYSGNYTLNVTDFHGCSVTASCELKPKVTPIEIEFIGAKDANCTNQQGTLIFYVVPGTGTPPYTLYAVGPNQHPVMTSQGYILQDTTVQPNQLLFYMVCDANFCCSEMLNLTITAAQDVTVGIIVNEYPCSSTTNSGSLTAVVSPPNAAYSYAWYRDGQLLTYIPSNANTVNGLFNGVYQVVVTDKRTNCYNFAQVVLTNAANMVFTYERQTDHDPAVLQGVIAGGNGAPFTVRIAPPELVNTPDFPLIVAITPQTASYSVVTIYQIPPTLTFRIDFFDSHGCALSVVTNGKQLNTDVIVITPSSTPFVPPVRIKPPNLLPIYLVSMFLLSFMVVMFLLFVFEIKRRRP